MTGLATLSGGKPMRTSGAMLPAEERCTDFKVTGGRNRRTTRLGCSSSKVSALSSDRLDRTTRASRWMTVEQIAAFVRQQARVRAPVSKYPGKVLFCFGQIRAGSGRSRHPSVPPGRRLPCRPICKCRKRCQGDQARSNNQGDRSPPVNAHTPALLVLCWATLLHTPLITSEEDRDELLEHVARQQIISILARQEDRRRLGDLHLRVDGHTLSQVLRQLHIDAFSRQRSSLRTRRKRVAGRAKQHKRENRADRDEGISHHNGPHVLRTCAYRRGKPTSRARSSTAWQTPGTDPPRSRRVRHALLRTVDRSHCIRSRRLPTSVSFATRTGW